MAAFRTERKSPTEAILGWGVLPPEGNREREESEASPGLLAWGMLSLALLLNGPNSRGKWLLAFGSHELPLGPLPSEDAPRH